MSIMQSSAAAVPQLHVAPAPHVMVQPPPTHESIVQVPPGGQSMLQRPPEQAPISMVDAPSLVSGPM